MTAPDLRAVRNAHPAWEIWQSRAGRRLTGIFYATPARRDPEHTAVTLTADDTGRLDRLIRAQEDYWDGLAVAPPGVCLAGLIAL